MCRWRGSLARSRPFTSSMWRCLQVAGWLLVAGLSPTRDAVQHGSSFSLIAPGQDAQYWHKSPRSRVEGFSRQAAAMQCRALHHCSFTLLSQFAPTWTVHCRESCGTAFAGAGLPVRLLRRGVLCSAGAGWPCGGGRAGGPRCARAPAAGGLQRPGAGSCERYTAALSARADLGALSVSAAENCTCWV